ncbi:MAG: RsmD family RNA methyltransferase, partial [Clostridia bacterium]|nr:RsmD family RNA methyltransferase [Clostridia bacterium]
MRIDAGKYKGRRLLENKYDHIRPTTDKVRQALFVKLQFFVPDKKVLDLFCGTGALGIEALSRGAEKVVFVDKDARSVM